MKTNQNLTRKMGDFDVIQRTQDGMFDGNALLRQWNAIPENTERKMSRFIDSPDTAKFIETIKKRESHSAKMHDGDTQVIKFSKGRNTKAGKTPDQVWMHPFLFIDFAMWINPEFKYDVIRFVYDELIKYRNDAGDAYREMSSAVAKIVPKSFLPTSIQKVAQALNFIVYNQHETEIRNKQADEGKVRELSELEKDVAKLIDGNFIKSFDHLISYLRKRWSDKHTPKALTS